MVWFARVLLLLFSMLVFCSDFVPVQCLRTLWRRLQSLPSDAIRMGKNEGTQTTNAKKRAVHDVWVKDKLSTRKLGLLDKFWILLCFSLVTCEALLCKPADSTKAGLVRARECEGLPKRVY